MKKITSFILIFIYLVYYFPIFPSYAQESNEDETGDFGDTNTDIRSFSSKQILHKTKDVSQKEEQTDVSGLFYSIHVLGEVRKPGIYRIIPSKRISDVITQAGGILSNGSERRIQLRRQNNVQVLDLFYYKYFGSLNNNPYLIENDVVFIPVIKGEIQIEGPVNRPGNYEWVGPISLSQAISLAGGFASGVSYSEPVRIIRYNEQEKKELLEVANLPASLKKFNLKKGDVVVVPHILIADKSFDYNLKRLPGDNIFHPTVDDNVYVTGAVEGPGAYPYAPYMTYKEYASLAGITATGSLKRTYIIKRGETKRKRVSKKTEISPGDTIIVYAKGITVTNALAWFTSITSVTLTTLLLYDNIKNR